MVTINLQLFTDIPVSYITIVRLLYEQYIIFIANPTLNPISEL